MIEGSKASGFSLSSQLNPLRYLYGDLRHRVVHLDPRRRRRSRNTPVRVDKLIVLVGLKRSGLHAVSNWLLGLEPGARLVNNSPMKRLGWSSPMSRTRYDSPLPIYLHPGSTAVGLDVAGQEYAVKLRKRESLVVVLFQSQSLAHLASTSVLCGVEATQTHTLLQLRDPFNWSASYRAKSMEVSADHQWPKLWREYAREYIGGSQYLPAALRVNYNRWLSEQSYRETIAEHLGLRFVDNYRAVVTNHAGGSSFDKTRFDGDAGSMNLTSRWHHFQEDPEYLACLRANLDVVKLGLDIFDLPADLRRFGQVLVKQNDL